jgi:coproporphyrinogen III oxidase
MIKEDSLVTKDTISEGFRALQLRICKALEEIDGKAFFKEDAWDREEGGGGFTCTLKEGAVLEKGGVAFSAVHGPVTPAMKKQLGLEGETFFATGVSVVLHPHNPHIPIIHMNVRYFEMDNGEKYWFGGGIDLTPHYIVEDQAVLFHRQLKVICDKYSSVFYQKFKPWADEYFYIPHRAESRGIGGIFFDHQSAEEGITKEQLFSFCKDLGDNFSFIYEEQVLLGKEKVFSEQEILWRNFRRGRYVEFNLVHDRGTKFGLFSGGRTESILMSLPPMAQWEYNLQVKKESPEGKTMDFLKSNTDWLVSFQK